MQSPRNPSLTSSPDSIFLELEWLALLAEDGPLTDDFAGVLRTSRVWRLVHPRPRRFPSQAVAIIATTALFPRPLLAEAPAHAAQQMAESRVTITVVDAADGRPVSGAQLVMPGTGQRKGLTDASGKTTVPLTALQGGEVLVEKEGYRPFPLMTHQLRPGRTVFVGLARLPGTAPPTRIEPPVAAATPEARVATPEPHRASPEPMAAAPTPRPTRTPRLEVWPVKATPRPTPQAAEPEPTPEPETAFEEPTPKPVVAARPTAAPAVARVPKKKRLRTVKASARRTPEPMAKAGGRYRVFPGDSLWQIAQKRYGDPYLWSAIYRANSRKIRDPDMIFPGQVFTIPALQVARGAAPPGGGRVTVHSGDSLWRLAGQHLGDPMRWRSIYRLNRRLVANPDLIFPGQVLRLPTV